MDAVSVLDQCGIARDRLIKEKAEIYGQLAEINRDIRAVRKKLEQYREIKSALPQIKQEIQKIENKEKEVKEYEHRRR
jgi:predicted transcriptional regulator